MAADRKTMIAELRDVVQPFLRTAGFVGSFPHYRRPKENYIDLLTFQFDRHGGGFVVEIARCPISGIVTAWGAVISPSKVSAWDVNLKFRKRLKPLGVDVDDHWFRFDATPVTFVAHQTLRCLKDFDPWLNLPVGKAKM